LPEAVFVEYVKRLPPSLKETNKRYIRWQDRTANLLGKMLLIAGIRSLGLKLTLSDLKFDIHNRPYFNKLIDFSISHSGEYVICVLGIGQQLGIDIEEIKTIEFGDFKQVFTQEQFELIYSAPDPYAQFFKLWTIKESVVKADGRGLSLSLHDIIIRQNTAILLHKQWFVKDIKIADNYSTSLASTFEGDLLSESELDCKMILQF
jgi:4'-phosphopantetheinyl transferase